LVNVIEDIRLSFKKQHTLRFRTFQNIYPPEGIVSAMLYGIILVIIYINVSIRKERLAYVF